MTTKATPKSISVENTVDSGRTRRGKNTLDTRLELPTRQALDLVKVELKAFQASSPAYENTRYGMPCGAGSFATLPKTKAKMTAASSGCKITHRTPSPV